MAKRDYYEIMEIDRNSLGADEKANHIVLRQAFRRLANKFHPDKNPGKKTAEDNMKEVNEAYGVLDDPEKRRRYDELGHHAEFIPTAQPSYGTASGGISGVMTDPTDWQISGGLRKDPELDKALSSAVEEGNVGKAREVIERMKAANALNMEITSFLGVSLIHTAAADKSDNVEMLKLLLDNGADPLKFNGVNGFLPLHAAVAAANPKCTDVLLKYTDPNALTENGGTYWPRSTPLKAFIGGMLADGRNPPYESPYMKMLPEKRKEMDERRIATAKLLLDDGADPDLRGVSGVPGEQAQTPLETLRKYSMRMEDPDEGLMHIDEMACVPEIIRLFELSKKHGLPAASSSGLLLSGLKEIPGPKEITSEGHPL